MVAFRDDERQYRSGRRLDREDEPRWTDSGREDDREEPTSLRWMSSRDRERAADWRDAPERRGDYSAASGHQAFGGMTGGYAGALFRPSESYTGRGPKNWRRSAERIREDVADALTAHPDVDASEIDVEVSEAEVTLTGTVESRHQKRAAEDCAWNISGVRDVHNRIRVIATAGNP